MSSFILQKPRKNKTLPLGTKISLKHPHFNKGMQTHFQGKNTFTNFFHPILSQKRAEEQLEDDERLNAKDFESEINLGQTVNSKNNWSDSIQSQTPCENVADSILSEYKLQDILGDYKTYFMERLTNHIVKSSSSLLNYKVFHSLRGVSGIN